MNAFTNAQWDVEDKVNYRLLNVSQGGAQTFNDKRLTIFNKVDLPAPLRPTKHTRSLGSICSSA